MTYRNDPDPRVNRALKPDRRARGAWIVGLLALILIVGAIFFWPHANDNAASNTTNGPTVTGPARVNPPATTTGSGTASPTPSGPGTPNTTR